MCVITIRKPHGKYTRAMAKQQIEQNSDGSGFMYARNGKLHIHKGMWSLRQFWKELRKHTRPDELVVIHHRWATHGARDRARCHPFRVNPNVGLAHNGVFTHLNSYDLDWWEDETFWEKHENFNWEKMDPQEMYETQRGRRSDTQVFAEDVIKPLLGLHKTWFPDKPGRFHRSVILDTLALKDAVVLLDRQGRLTYSGGWHRDEPQGLWHSNMQWDNRGYGGGGWNMDDDDSIENGAYGVRGWRGHYGG